MGKDVSPKRPTCLTDALHFAFCVAKRSSTDASEMRPYLLEFR